MDGGGLAINQSGKVQTVWRRQGKIFTAMPDIPEIEVGEAKAALWKRLIIKMFMLDREWRGSLHQIRRAKESARQGS